MRTALVACCLLSSALGAASPAMPPTESLAELETFEQKNVAPKLDLMCGTVHLAVHIDPQMSQVRVNDKRTDHPAWQLCEEPLRWLFHICGDAEGRQTIAATHVRSYECKLATSSARGASLEDGGKLVVSWSRTSQPVEGTQSDVEHALRARMTTKSLKPLPEDAAWRAFTRAPIPVPTNESFCEVDGKRGPLPPSGDPMAPKTAHVHCVSNGKVVTDLVPGPGGYTGFSTMIEGGLVSFATWRRGQLDGDWWKKAGKTTVEARLYMSGGVAMSALYDPDSGQLRHRGLPLPQPSYIEVDPHGLVTELLCGTGAPQDEVFRDYCGYDKPRKVRVKESFGVRTYTYDRGQITATE